MEVELLLLLAALLIDLLVSLLVLVADWLDVVVADWVEDIHALTLALSVEICVIERRKIRDVFEKVSCGCRSAGSLQNVHVHTGHFRYAGVNSNDLRLPS